MGVIGPDVCAQDEIADAAMIPGSYPILECEAARALETRWFAGDAAREWAAMQRAGNAIARAILADFRELGGWPRNPRLLVLVGKGHNGGDALIAARALLAIHPTAKADILFAFGPRILRPLAARAWQTLADAGRGRIVELAPHALADQSYDLSIDGVFGFQFRPPLDAETAALFTRVAALRIRLRAAVDLPSAGMLGADFTYATGSVKTPAVESAVAGRVRFVDLGFLGDQDPGTDRVLTPAVLAPLAALRPIRSDKRSYGHVFVIGGSREFPGAILMTVQAALRSGAGLVTAFVPESLAPGFAARAPEAMWVGWPETPLGSLALEGEHLLRTKVARATAMVLGPGLGREPETLALAASVVGCATIPLVIDADALQPEIIRLGRAPRIVTPHAGEYARMAGEADVRSFAAQTGSTVVLKGPVTRIAGGTRGTSAASRPPGVSAHPEPSIVYHSFLGGPVLARGGSGDLLAGLIGGLLAQTPGDPLLAAARGVVWHGAAADCLAREHGQAGVVVTQLLDFLPRALRECAHDS